MTINEEFEEKTKGKFNFIKFTKLEIKPDSTVVIQAVYDSHFIKRIDLEGYKREIDDVVGTILNVNNPYYIRYTPSYFSFQDVAEGVLKFFHINSMTIYASLERENITVSYENGMVNVLIKIPSSLMDFTNILEYAPIVENYLNSSSFNRHKVIFEKYDLDYNKIKESLERERVVPSYKYALDGGRTIDPKNRIRCFKKPVGGVAGYIIDQNNEGDAILYGCIENAKQREYKDKKKEDVMHKFVTFTLNDTTATIRCIYFDKTKEQNMTNFIENDKYIIAKGKLELDSYKNDGSLQFVVSIFDYCEKTEFEINNITRELNNDYLVIKPRPYVSKHQDNIFNDLAQFPFEKMVLFDLYTATEDGKREGKLIEIAGVKIDGYKIIETFNTFINPQKEVSVIIRRNLELLLSNYTAEPTFDKVLPDFKLFCSGYPLGTNYLRENVDILNNYYEKLLFEKEDMANIVDICKIARSENIPLSKAKRPLEKLIDIATLLGA